MILLSTKFITFILKFQEEEGCETKAKQTKFLALDKCLPRRQFLQVVNIKENKMETKTLKHDLEWLTILRLTNHLTSVKNQMTFMPGPGSNDRSVFKFYLY